MIIDLIFGNLGRAPRAELVEQSQRSLRMAAEEALSHGNPVFVGLVEIGEGDKGYDDRAILAREWTSVVRSPWKVLHEDAREVLIYAKRQAELVSSRTRRAGRAVKRQSPARPVHIDRFDDDSAGPAITVLLWHSAAGAKNGHRAPEAKALLTDSWRRTRRIARRAARNARRRGDHVLYMADVNDRGWGRLTRHETEHIQHGPDVIGVIPAHGWTARLRRQADIATYIEPRMHPGLHARAIFTPKEK